MHRSSLLFLVCVSLLVACSQTDSRQEALTVGQSFPVINGQPPDQPFHDAVVSLHDRNGNNVDPDEFCSGTLVTPDVVLTAGHCLDLGGFPMPASTVAVYFGDAPGQDPNGEFRAVIETAVHPQFDIQALTNDVALLRLAEPHPSITPVPILPAALGFTNSDVNTLALNFAGFGVNQSGGANVKLQITSLLGGLGCSVSGCFGSPTSFERATQISYSQGAGGVCSGDSGGPAFLTRNGTVYVGGITSYGDTRCRQYGVSTRVDAYEAFITAFTGVDSGGDDGGDDGGGGNTDTQLFEEANLSGSQGSETRFSFAIPAGASNLRVAITGGSGDADLYVRVGAAPTLQTYDCRPYRNGNNETCSFDSVAAGTYHIMLHGYRAYSGVTLMLQYDGPPPDDEGGDDGGGDDGGGPDPAPDFPVDTVVPSIARDGRATGSFDVPAGYTRLTFAISGGTGDADLYVRLGAAPTLQTYDCRPYKNGNNETCTFDNPTAGTYHVLVHGYRASSNVRFTASLD